MNEPVIRESLQISLRRDLTAEPVVKNVSVATRTRAARGAATLCSTRRGTGCL